MSNRRTFIKSVVGAAAVASVNPACIRVAAETAPGQANTGNPTTNNPIALDFKRPNGQLRALHGINKGPLPAGGIVDVIAAHRELGIPLTRLHDSHWPVSDVVDMHVVFPNPDADPLLPASYDFEKTDEYLDAIRATGSEILYRLGETIELTTSQRYAHPPRDPARWAEAAKGIIRHYNEGWANGFHYGIKRWEIWNEPETRPAMWTGTDAEFFHFYGIVARALKAAFPDLLIGGPGIGITGDLVGNDLTPSTILTGFLETCQRDKLPLDFLSWHCYSASNKPQELPLRAHHIRRILNDYGFTRAESYLDEWRNIPDWNWAPVARAADPHVRQAWYARMYGPESAAYIVGVLLGLQDAPVEAANFFHGELGGFGMFDESGVPYPNYYGMLAFRRLLDTPHRAFMDGPLPHGLAMDAGRADDNSKIGILVSNYDQGQSPLALQLNNLPWANASIVSAQLVDQAHRLEPGPNTARLDPGNLLVVSLDSPTVALITVGPEPT